MLCSKAEPQCRQMATYVRHRHEFIQFWESWQPSGQPLRQFVIPAVKHVEHYLIRTSNTVMYRKDV